MILQIPSEVIRKEIYRFILQPQKHLDAVVGLAQSLTETCRVTPYPQPLSLCLVPAGPCAGNGSGILDLLLAWANRDPVGGGFEFLLHPQEVLPFFFFFYYHESCEHLGKPEGCFPGLSRF